MRTLFALLLAALFPTASAQISPPSGGSGTVTSVGVASSGSTISVSGSPITTTGTINVDFNLGHANTWTAAQTFNSGDFGLNGSSSGTVTIQPPAAAGTNTITAPAATGTMALLNQSQTFSASQAGSITTLAISTATFTPDASNNHYYVHLVHANCPCTLANPSPSFVAGTSGVIEIQQSSSGSDTIGTWGSSYIAPGGTATITLSTGASAIDAIAYFVIDSTHIMLIPSLNFSH